MTIFLSYEDPEAALDMMEDNPRITKEWADNWFIHFNPQKTESLTRKREQDILTVRFDGTEVKEVMSHKHLGVTLQ